jgi:glycosyltransferase involved in cell wall biosynthesis
MQSTLKTPLIINCARGGRGNGFFQPHLGEQLRWQFVDADPQSAVERVIRKPDIARLRAGRQVAKAAMRDQADLVVSHDPRVSFACEYFLHKSGWRGHHLAFSFNLPALPKAGWTKDKMTRAFKTVERFTVFSTMEKELYAEAFEIPLEKIDFIHWGVNPPEVENADVALEQGDYICALGGNGRDYATLAAAMRKLPGIKLVLVARAHNLVGLELPGNVKLYQNIPFGRAMNLLKFSKFMVLPLAGSEVPCGHITLVNAMHLGKGFLISNSTGVRDYVMEGENAVTCAANSAGALVEGMERLWGDEKLCRRLGENGMRFAREKCSEASTLEYFKNYLQGIGILGDGEREMNNESAKAPTKVEVGS